MTEPTPRIAIVVNGEPREVAHGLTVRGLLEHLGIAGLAAVERCLLYTSDAADE